MSQQASKEQNTKEDGEGFAMSREERGDVHDLRPPRPVVLHETIRREGEQELARSVSALGWSSLAAGMTIGFSMLARALLQHHVQGLPGAFLIESLGYPFGFLVVILARQQLFTENTMTAVLPLMTEPGWVQAPSFEEWAAAYPANGGGVEGYAIAHCRVGLQGLLSRCVVAKELPVGRGFGKAAVALAAHFRASPEAMATAPRGAPIEVDVPIRFAPPAQASDRTVHAAAWIAGSDPVTLAQGLPAAKPGSPGAVVRCRVGDAGALEACEIEYTSPDGIDFDEAAVKLASHLRMSLWSAEASPVRGGVVHIAIRPSLALQAAN